MSQVEAVAATVEAALRRHNRVGGIRDGRPHCSCGWAGERGDDRVPHIAEDIAQSVAALEAEAQRIELQSLCDACYNEYDGHPEGHPDGCLCNYDRELGVVHHLACPLHGGLARRPARRRL